MLDSEKELHRKQRMKCFVYLVVFIIFQVAVFAALGLTILRVKSPKIRIDKVSILNSNFNTGASPSFSMAMVAEVSVKNKNWGDYKFSNSTMTISYQGVVVGEAQFPSGKAKARRTRRLTIRVDVNSDSLSAAGNTNLGNDLNSGAITLSSYTRLRGKATLMHFMKRKKSGEMNCVFRVNTARPGIENFTCK